MDFLSAFPHVASFSTLWWNHFSCQLFHMLPGQTGTDPPAICGTNSGYHSELKHISQLFLFCAVYAEFGGSSTDTISLTFTYGSTTSAKTWNVLLRQIACTASYKWVECSCHKLHEWQAMLNWQELPAQGSH